MKPTLAVIALVATAATALFGEQVEIRRGGDSVQFTDCPKCQYRMRIAPDGHQAFVNLSRLTDDKPSAAVLEERKSAMAERAFALMAVAGDVRKNAGSRMRPLMGWSSWNTFGLEISDSLILDTARAMATNGLKCAGYRYINIDDGFFVGHDEKGRLLLNLKRFPNGLKPVVDGIHSLGLKVGIYSDAGKNACGGERNVGLYGHDDDDCRFHFVENGFDFIKVDYCGATELKLDERTRYTEISKAIARTGRDDVRFNACRWAFPGTWIADITDSWRTTCDVRANWKSVRNIIGENLYLGAYLRPGHYNDLDMLEVGHHVGKTKTVFGEKVGDTGLTPLEEETHFGMWCMLSSPLLLGCDIRNLNSTTMALVTNPFLLSMNQNDLGAEPYVAVREAADAYVIVKDAGSLFGTSRFAAFYNAGDAEHEFAVRSDALELGGRISAFDLAERADLMPFDGEIRARVPAHGTKFLRLTGERRIDRRVYEAEAAYLNEYQEIRDSQVVGTAYPDKCDFASGGRIVRYLGNRITNYLAWRNVRVSKSGEYMLDFAYRSPDDRAFTVAIDGESPRTVEVKRSTCIRHVAIKTTLQAGTHKVLIANAAGWCPDFDNMTVTDLASRK